MIVPDPCLHTVPWQLLRAGPGDPYLTDLLDLTVTAALLNPQHHNSSADRTSPTAIVIGESEPASDPLERLFLETPIPENVHRWACLKTSTVFATRWVPLVHETMERVGAPPPQLL
jgi:hypothetical protein